MNQQPRQIKFKAISDREGVEIIDDLYWFEENGVHNFTEAGHWDKYRIFQFTGMYDFDGQEIYEGDTLISSTNELFIVFYQPPSFCYAPVSNRSTIYVLTGNLINFTTLRLYKPIQVDPQALNVKLENSDFTIQEFFKRCLIKLWMETGNFNSRRPLGSSDWDSDIIVSLIKAGYIPGIIEDGEDGDVDWDQQLATDYINVLIEQHLFKH